MTFATNKSAPTAGKMRGGYYTPQPLAEYLCRWAIRGSSESIVEPSCGDGSFVSIAAPMLGANGRITAIEIVLQELQQARSAVSGARAVMDWRCGSFFDLAPALLAGPGYGAAIGNPPFIRFQHFDRTAREKAFRMLNSFGYRPNGLAKAWVAFVQLAVELLRDGGRLATVVPGELLQVRYAAELRYRLPLLFEDVFVIAFDQLVFQEIQQEVLLLLCEGRNRDPGRHGRLHTRELANGEELLKLGGGAGMTSHLPDRYTHDDMKCTSLFLERDELRLLRDVAQSGNLDRLGNLAEVDVGIVTGRNSFFLVSRAQAEQLGVNGRAVDVVGRTGALKSIRFTADDLHCYAESSPAKLINLKGLDRSAFPPALNAYIRRAELEGVHAGYKCRIRNRWFDVPSVYAPDAFLFRQIHHAPLLVANEAGATATDTIHRVRTFAGADLTQLCASMVNSCTFA